MKEQIKNIIESYCEGINHLEFNIADLDKMADEILALQLPQTGVMQSVLINELRINNYYELKGNVLGGGVCQLKNLNDFMHIGNLIESDLVKPIILTNEWLINFGFKETKEDKKIKWFTKDRLDIVLGEENFIVFDHLVIKNIKYVHQFQNLYFSLKQNELTVA